MESQIAALLMQAVPPPAEAAAPVPQVAVTDEASSVQHQGLDELTSLKMHQYFGLALKGGRSDSINQVNFVYERIAETIGSYEYPLVVQAISQLERILGLSSDERRLFKLYSWTRLDKIRQLTEAEMGSIHG